SPDFCLDWNTLLTDARAGRVTEHAKSRFNTAVGSWTLLENAHGDHAWKLHTAGNTSALAGGAALADGTSLFPATWENLLQLKNLIQQHDAAATIFPSATQKLGQSTLGI